MAAVNTSLMAINGASLTQWRPADMSTVPFGKIQNIVVPPSRGLRVKCMAKIHNRRNLNPPLSLKPTFLLLTKTVGTKFGDVFAFGGPAPETINGRLAMLGFVSALVVEIASGRDLFSQLASGGVPLFLGSAVLLTLASVIPMFKGVSTESKSQAIMSAGAEMWNGRFAMIGLIALAFTEYLKGGPLIS